MDILDDNLKFKPLIKLNADMNTVITQMKYNSIRSAIPVHWKKIIKDNRNNPNTSMTRLNDVPFIKINNCLKPLSKCTNKHIYIINYYVPK